ncbi:DUF4367 domain-containing protein [Sporosarcina limicola]|uniref:DUF4367 domain-containing protein n=1 Tax=Sporosarcina limicola TaxID=34101 RepID=A0A927MK89_9BACL|nr:DUF4367 domain-containing protein [Sporosarcina limicola]MBE1556250.1 hypothetical protein [Sporosarcina limicola]
MSESEKHDMDQLIKETMEEKKRECPPPELTSAEVWKKMEDSRKVTGNLLKKKRIPKKVFLAVASIFIVLIIASYPQKGVAFSRWSGMFQKVQGSVVQLFGSSGELPEDQMNAPDFYVIEDSGPVMVQMNLEEAKKVTNFPITIPKVPTEFQLKQVSVMQEKRKKSDEIYLNYVGDERGFIIEEKALSGQFIFGKTVDMDDTKVEEVFINGEQGSLLAFKNGVYSLTWMTQSNYFHIEGKLTKEEIIKIASTM